MYFFPHGKLEIHKCLRAKKEKKKTIVINHFTNGTGRG